MHPPGRSRVEQYKSLPYSWMWMCMMRLRYPSQPPRHQPFLSPRCSSSPVAVIITIITIATAPASGEPAEPRDLRHTSRINYSPAIPTANHVTIITTPPAVQLRLLLPFTARRATRSISSPTSGTTNPPPARRSTAGGPHSCSAATEKQ